MTDSFLNTDQGKKMFAILNDRIELFKKNPVIRADFDRVEREHGTEAAQQYVVNMAVLTLCTSPEEREAAQKKREANEHEAKLVILSRCNGNYDRVYFREDPFPKNDLMAVTVGNITYREFSSGFVDAYIHPK